MGQVLSSSFAPSHSVFTALWLSLVTWFPCQALLFCLQPHPLPLSGLRTPLAEREPPFPGPTMSTISCLQAVSAASSFPALFRAEVSSMHIN